jgi:hypothetical protein
MQCLSSIILSPLNSNVKMSPMNRETVTLSQRELQRVEVISGACKIIWRVPEPRSCSTYRLALGSRRRTRAAERLSPRLAERSRPTAHRPGPAGRCLWQNPRSRILLLANSSIPAREGFFCEIRHSQHILRLFSEELPGWLSGWENFTRIGVARLWCRCGLLAPPTMPLRDRRQ